VTPGLLQERLEIPRHLADEEGLPGPDDYSVFVYLNVHVGGERHGRRPPTA